MTIVEAILYMYQYHGYTYERCMELANGLPQKDIDYIKSEIKKFDTVEEVEIEE